jgi:PAS domain-containing protein
MGRSLIQDFITNNFRTAVQAVLVKAPEGDDTNNFEFSLFTKSETCIELLLNATTRQDEQGNVIGFVGIGQDIKARLVQEVKYSKLINTANVPIFSINTVGHVNMWNQCGMQLVGYSTEEVMGHSLVEEFISQKKYVLLCKMSPASHFFFCEKVKKNCSQLS